MLSEISFFDNSERYTIERAIIDAVALPLGDRYEDSLFSGYFADYCGMVRKYRPARVLEIGVRYGYTAIAMQHAFRDLKGKPSFEYVGLDDESYHGGSCAAANANFAQSCPWATMQAIKHNSFHGLPEGIGQFGFIHVDGNHDHNGVENDLRLVWPVLQTGGVILLDDATTPGIARAIDEFLAQFVGDEETEVLFQRQANERNHVYIMKSGVVTVA